MMGLLVAEYAQRKQAELPTGPIHTRERQLSRALSSPTVITACWIAAFLLLWSTAAASYIPSPLDVLRALPPLWDDGLGVQLWSSMGP